VFLSWTKDMDDGVKYFSGTATYSKSFELKKDIGKSGVFLELGKVGDMAEITLNGKNWICFGKHLFELMLLILMGPVKLQVLAIQ
jgi:hypothetical protein